MAVFSGSDEVVIGNIVPCPEDLEAVDDLVDVGLWTNSLGLRNSFDFLSVLIGTCQEQYIIADEPVPTG